MKKISLSIVLILFGLNTVSCRKDRPPTISIICTMDGHGGGDCVTQDGTRKYMLPSEMVGMWATTQDDQARFASWCYRVPLTRAQAEMNRIKSAIKGDGVPIQSEQLDEASLLLDR